MANPIDLEAYLARIGYSGQLARDLPTLRALHERHVASIPFENIDVQRGLPISLQLPDIERKLVAEGRGGYCFEHNSLFRAAIERIGFPVTPRLARVRWMTPPDVETAMSHLALVVDVGGEPWLCDVGFGGIGLIHPIRWQSRETQHEAFEPRRLIETDRGLMHQARLRDEWRDVYCIQNLQVSHIDLEVGNWYTSAHPASRFRQALIVTLGGPNGRASLLNNELTLRDSSGSVTVRVLREKAELLEVLDETFGIRLSQEAAATLPFAAPTLATR